jgi:hypothetical protein
MYLIPVPALADNDVWLLHGRNHALMVKPGDAGRVMAASNDHDPKLESILVMRRQAGHAIAIAIKKRAAPTTARTHLGRMIEVWPSECSGRPRLR